MFVSNKNFKDSFSDSTLILVLNFKNIIKLILFKPALSIGNIGQYTIDTMIATLKSVKVGDFDEEFMVPVIGNDVFTKTGTGVVCTSAELYHSQAEEGKKDSFTFFQQRAPIINGYNKIFSQHLIKFVEDNKFKEIVLLLSTDATYRFDSQLNDTPLRYILTSSNKEDDERKKNLEELGWKSLESISFNQVLKNGTLSKNLYDTCVEKKYPLTILVMFVHEGYNIPDALQMASWVDQYKSIFPVDQKPSWVLPNSWKYLLNSPSFDQRIYG